MDYLCIVETLRSLLLLQYTINQPEYSTLEYTFGFLFGYFSVCLRQIFYLLTFLMQLILRLFFFFSFNV